MAETTSRIGTDGKGSLRVLGRKGTRESIFPALPGSQTCLLPPEAETDGAPCYTRATPTTLTQLSQGLIQHIEAILTDMWEVRLRAYTLTQL